MSRVTHQEFVVTSGKPDNPGRISKAGDRDVRMTLYTAAHALMIRSDAWSTL